MTTEIGSAQISRSVPFVGLYVMVGALLEHSRETQQQVLKRELERVEDQLE